VRESEQIFKIIKMFVICDVHFLKFIKSHFVVNNFGQRFHFLPKVFTKLVLPTAVPGNTKGGSITVLSTSCLTGLNWSVLQIKTKIVSSHAADSKPVKQEVNGTVILPPLVFPGGTLTWSSFSKGIWHVL
jgi:hypothetical protein